MKILVIGFNQNQCIRQYYLRQQLQVVPPHYSLVNYFLLLGHEMHHRTVTLGEDLSQYDEVIVYIASPNQRVAKRSYEVLWTISQHPQCILSFDDWQVTKMWKDVCKVGDGQGLFREFIWKTNGKSLEDVKVYEKELREGLETVVKKKNRVLIAAYRIEHLGEPEDYGSHVLFDRIGYPRESVYVFNQSPFHRNRSWEDPCLDGEENPGWKGSHSFTSARKKVGKRAAKERRFNFASLVQSMTRKWLKQQCGAVVKSRARRGVQQVNFQVALGRGHWTCTGRYLEDRND